MEKYQDIINKIAKKDADGLRDLYEAYGRKFYSYAIHKWHLPEDDAWDIVYKTLETLLLKLSKYEFESESKFNGFLYTVLLNFIRQHFRSKRSKEKNAFEYVDLNSEEGISYETSKIINRNAFNEYYSTETIDSPALQQLKESLNKLDEQERDLLLLRSQNYSYDEIASLLNIENNQLKVKYHRAKKKLIDMLDLPTTNIISHE
jgi:RNA polymerase sigma factor (sigma-70 family)